MSAPVSPLPAPSEALRYNDKVCIITGGTQGIGEGILRVFVKNGATVVFCGKELEKGKALAEELEKSGPGQAVLLECDLTKEDDIKNLVSKTIEKFGKLDCLINNAGWHPPHQTIDEVSAEDFRKLIDLNLMGYFLMCKYCLPHLRKSQGCIVNNSSLVATIGQAGAVPYVATKGAIAAMTRALAIDEAKNHVRVNSFSPSNIWTPMWDNYAQSLADPQVVIAGGADQQLMGRFGTIQEAGELVLFLASQATFMTGVDVPLSGGAEINYGCKSVFK